MRKPKMKEWKAELLLNNEVFDYMIFDSPNDESAMLYAVKRLGNAYPNEYEKGCIHITLNK